jgi:hypothetical protein
MRREILLIEDNADSRDALAWLLEHHGYAVRTADNGATALDEAGRRISSSPIWRCPCCRVSICCSSFASSPCSLIFR